MSDLPATASSALPAIDAYELLSKPTLELSDADVALIVADLRKRRGAFLSSGKADRPKAIAKAKADPLSKEAKQLQKAAATADLLASLNLGGK